MCEHKWPTAVRNCKIFNSRGLVQGGWTRKKAELEGRCGAKPVKKQKTAGIHQPLCYWALPLQGYTTTLISPYGSYWIGYQYPHCQMWFTIQAQCPKSRINSLHICSRNNWSMFRHWPQAQDSNIAFSNSLLIRNNKSNRVAFQAHPALLSVWTSGQLHKGRWTRYYLGTLKCSKEMSKKKVIIEG